MQDLSPQFHHQPTPEALAEADHLTHLAGLLYANAAVDAEQAGDETRARDLWQRANQNLTPVAEDATATPAQLLDRAADDYATGWGSTNTRTHAEGSSD